MNKKTKQSIRDIVTELYAAQAALGWRVKEILAEALSRSYETISLVQDKQTAVELIFKQLRPNETVPKKKLTKKQIQKVSNEMDYWIEFNKQAVQYYEKRLKKIFSEETVSILLRSGHAYINSGLYDNSSEEWEGPERGVFIPDDWQGIIGRQIDGELKAGFLLDYLLNQKDFIGILSDEKVLMCSTVELDAIFEMNSVPMSYRYREFCYLLSYAYLGITPIGTSFKSFYSEMLLEEDLSSFSTATFIEYIIKQTTNSLRVLFGSKGPKFLSYALEAAKCRYDIDRGLPTSATSLAKLAGVDRKTIINAKLSRDTSSISSERALDFLSQPARNRWVEKDEEGIPMGPKIAQCFGFWGLSENFYPSAEDLEVKPIKSKEK